MTHAGDVTTVYTVEEDRRLTVWRHRDFTAIGDQAARFTPPGRWIRDAVVSADGKTLVVVSEDEDATTFCARAYDLQMMAQMCKFRTKKYYLEACALSADGSLLLVIGYGINLLLDVYDVAGGALVLETVLWAADMVPGWFQYEFAPDGKYAVVAARQGNGLTEIASYEMPRTSSQIDSYPEEGWGRTEKGIHRHAHATGGRRFCISQSGRYVVACQNEQAVVEWFDTATMQLLHTLTMHEAGRTKLALPYMATYMTEESDRSVLLVQSEPHTLEVVDPLEGVKLTAPPERGRYQEYPTLICINDAVFEMFNWGLRGRDLRTGDERLRIDCPLPITFTWSPSGKVLVATKRHVLVFDDYLLKAAARLAGVKSASNRRDATH